MATEEEKKAAQLERDSITVSTNKVEEKEKVEAADDKSEAETKEEVEEKETEIEAKSEEVEDLEVEKEEAKTDKDKERIQKRIDKLTAQNAASKRRIVELEAALAAKPDDEKVLTEKDVNDRARAIAEQTVAAQEFEAAISRIADSCKKIDKDYRVKVNALAEEVNSLIPPTMINVLDDLPNHGGNVLMYLTKNVDEYEEIHLLSPARMALKLKDISDKLNKKPQKEISKVPEPKDIVQGKGNTPEARANEKDDMATFVAKRAKEVEERRKARMGLH